MQRLIRKGIALVIVILAFSPVHGEEYKPLDGDSWNCKRIDDQKIRNAVCQFIRIGIVTGYWEGFNEAATSALLYFKSKSQDKTAQTLGDYMDSEYYIKNAQYEDVISGLNEFYSHFENRPIELASAMSIIRMRIVGEKKEYIECNIEVDRLYSHGKRDEGIRQYGECLELKRSPASK